MKNSELLLFFFITWDIIITFILFSIIIKMRSKIKELKKYSEDVTIELVKLRKK